MSVAVSVFSSSLWHSSEVLFTLLTHSFDSFQSTSFSFFLAERDVLLSSGGGFCSRVLQRKISKPSLQVSLQMTQN
jgi:hypothetical protein